MSGRLRQVWLYIRASETAHYPFDCQPRAISSIVHFHDDSHETFEVDLS